MDINNIGSVRSDINEVMSKIREVSNKSKIFSEKNITQESNEFQSVFSVIKDAISNVNQTQMAFEDTQKAYLSGASNMSLSQIAVASQKSKLAFEGLLAVRNKILEAYKEVMNMQV